MVCHVMSRKVQKERFPISPDWRKGKDRPRTSRSDLAAAAAAADDATTFLGRQVQPRLHFFVGGL